MPLQQLIEYFNDRLEWEHHANFRPFILENGNAHGIFGPIKVGSSFAPLRETLRPSVIAGYAAVLTVSIAETDYLKSQDIDLLLSLPAQQSVQPESVVNFDRLTRTVHMLNYLPVSHLEGLLQLDVDPRHILGIKKDHGAYFEEVIVKCGLNTSNILITLAVNSAYASYYQVLLKGLENYRQRGYRLALKFDYLTLGPASIDMIRVLEPDYVCLSARNLDTVKDNKLLDKLYALNSLTGSGNGRTVMLHANDRKTASLARKTGFWLVQGNYYEKSSTAEECDFSIRAA